MSGECYYGEPGTEERDHNFPYVQLATMEALRYWLCSSLYPNENYVDSQQRFYLASFEDGTDKAITESIEQFQDVQGNFPLTAYSLSGESIVREDFFVPYEKSGRYYSSVFSGNLTTLPIIWEVQLMTIYTQPSDYFVGKTILEKLNGKLQRLVVPITVNGVLDYFTVDVRMEISKGGMAWNKDQREQYGDLYEILHTAQVYIRYVVFDDANINPVDDVELALHNLSDIDYSQSIQIDFISLMDQPVITSTYPVNGETAVDIDASVTNIIINFNVAMNEITVEDSLSMSPHISAELNWNDDSTQLVIDLVEDLQADTEYTINISSNAKNIMNNNIDDYEFIFTTL